MQEMPAHRIVATEDLCPSVFYAWMLVQAGKKKPCVVPVPLSDTA